MGTFRTRHGRGRGRSIISGRTVEALEPRRLFSGEVVTQLVLVDADTDQAIGPIVSGDVINFAVLGTNRVNVVAETAGPTASVRFALDSNGNFRTENSAPYSLAGDTAGDYKPWTPTLGTHALKATPYSADSAGGTAGTPLEVTFTVVDEVVADPVAVEASAADLAFGEVAVGSFGEASVTLTNPSAPGGSSVTITSTTIAGAAFSDSFDDAADVTLAPGQGLTLAVRFTPTAGGPATGTLSVQHTGTNSPLSISLSGTGLASNTAPVLAPIGNRTVAAGTTTSISVSATDADGDSIALSAANLPAWATFADNGDGTGLLTLAPPAGTSGTISGVTITATDDGDSILSDSETISLTSTDSSVAVLRLMLYRADTDVPLRELVHDDEINFAAIGTNKLSIIAETTDATQSVRFALDGNSNYRTENGLPYTIAGETGTDIRAWTPSIGTHTVRATPFSADSAAGTAGVPLEISFRVIDEALSDPVDVSVSATALDFGFVVAGTSGEALLTLTNPGEVGSSSVTVLSTYIVGSTTFSDDFNDATDVTFEPGQAVTVRVRFTPTAEGSSSATLNVRHSGTNSPLTIALSGTGVVSNHAPVLAPVGDKQVLPGATLTVPVSATDSDGDAIVLSASNLPAWGTFTDNGDGTGTLVLAPPLGASGTAAVTLTATDDGDPVMNDAETVTVTVSDSSVVVHGLTLINAETDQPISPLGNTVNFALIGTRKLNVRADTLAGTMSVRFGLDANGNYRTENSAPYALAGDSAGNYSAWTPSVGTHTVTATPFSGTSASGTAGSTHAVTFNVIEGSTLTASPTEVAVSAAQGGTTTDGSVSIGTNDGIAAGYTATSNAAWLTVLNPSGTTDQPLSFRADTTGLAVGSHPGYITLHSSTHAGVKIPVTLTVTGAFVADQIHLSYVQDPSSTITVVWRTMDTSTPSVVEYRPAGGSWMSVAGGLRASGTQGTLHEVTLSGLTPATIYEYRVRGDNGAWSPLSTAHTMPARGPADFDLVYFGDTGLIGRTDGLDTGTAQAIAEMLKLDPDLLLPGGDYAYFNTDTRYGTLDNSIDAWFNQNQPLFSRVPIMPTYGNHEVLLGEGYDAWAARFATPQGWSGQRNYSFDVGKVHFVSILAVSDTAELSSSSITWLRNDLAAASDAEYIIPYMHVPAFSDGTSHPSNTALRAQLGPIFEEFGVKVVLASHDQSYERTYPLTGVPSDITLTSTSLSDYGTNDCVTWIKVSPAGKLSNRSGVNDFSKFQTYPAPFWTASRDDTMHHFSRLVFSSTGTLRVESYGFSGDGTRATLIDSFQYDLGGADAVSNMESEPTETSASGGTSDPVWYGGNLTSDAEQENDDDAATSLLLM